MIGFITLRHSLQAKILHIQSAKMRLEIFVVDDIKKLFSAIVYFLPDFGCKFRIGLPDAPSNEAVARF